MPKFVAAQYVVNDPPAPVPMIRAVDEEGTVWWLQEGCQQGDWLRFVEEGGTVLAADDDTPEGDPV